MGIGHSAAHRGGHVQKGSGAGKCAGAKSNPVRRRSNHARTEDQAGREKRANTDAAGGVTPQSTFQEGTLQQDPNTLASCAKETYGPGQPQGRAGTGQHKPWQEQRGYGWSETPLATPAPRGPTLNHPEEVFPKEGKCYRSVKTGDTLAFKQQMLNVAPSVLPSRMSPRSRTKIGT